MSAPDYTAIYDGACAVCTRTAQALARWDREGRIEVVPSTDPALAARFPSITPADMERALQLVAADGRRWEGAAAVEELLLALPKGCLFSWLFALPFGRRLADVSYRAFARNRYRFGCGDHCPVRPPRPGARA